MLVSKSDKCHVRSNVKGTHVEANEKQMIEKSLVKEGDVSSLTEVDSCTEPSDKYADKMDVPVNRNVRRLSFLAGKIALGFSLKQILKEQVVGEVSSSACVERCVEDDIKVQQNSDDTEIQHKSIVDIGDEKVADKNSILHGGEEDHKPLPTPRKAKDDNHFKATVDTTATIEEASNNNNG